MDDVQASVLQEFMAITGVEDPNVASNVLDATNWELEEAVNLQFATGGDMSGAGAASAGGAGHGAANDIPPHLLEEEEVRAPMPAVVDRLYDDVPGHHGIPARVARYGAPPDRGPTHVDVFKDFGPSAGTGAAASSGAAAGGNSSRAAAGGPAAAAGNAPKLSDLFKPPAGLLFAGDWEAAVAQAGQQGRWLLLNVQSADEFATHRLNRDTWGDTLVQEMIKGTFVFWQVYNTADQGQALVHQYHLQQLPACVIVDPITRAKLWERYGFISAEGLVEELVPYMDCGPNDPGASELAQRAFHQAAKRRHKEAAQPASGGGGAAGDAMANMSEEDQLALALAMSVEQPAAGGAGPAAGDESDDDMDDLDEDAIWQEVHRRQREEEAAAALPAAAEAGGTPGTAAPSSATTAAVAKSAPAAAPAAVDIAALQAAAACRLPAEPAEGAAGACRVAFRLPDGRREQRRFHTTDTVAALQDFCISVSADAAGLASFQLSEARPGAQPLADPAATIADAGVANAMLVLKPTS